MIKNSESLKGMLRKISEKKHIQVQTLSKCFFMEKLLLKISKSKYKNNFILKGGFLISSLTDIEQRTTLDMDTTVKNIDFNRDNLYKVLNEILAIPVDEDLTYSIQSLEPIREEDIYGGYRATIICYFNVLREYIKIDITTGDIIVKKEQLYPYKSFLNEDTIEIYAYPLETIITEKYEAIMTKGALSTRLKDYYDMVLLLNSQTIDHDILIESIKKSSMHRNTFDLMNDITYVNKTISQIESSQELRQLWHSYQLQHYYAKDITYEECVEAIKRIVNLYFSKNQK